MDHSRLNLNELEGIKLLWERIATATYRTQLLIRH